jgi:uncharacterized protein (TIGR02147 family)
MINIFKYQDYRTYLSDYYREQKENLKYFSYRTFSQKAGIRSSSFLHHVIDGKKNLTKNSIVKVSKAVGHNRTESEYFENLVFFNQAKSITEKTHYYTRLVEARCPIEIENIGIERYEYYAKWYHSVIREIVTFFDFQDDYKRLANFVVPPITVSQAKQSIQLLLSLEFIRKDEQGRYHQTNEFIKTRPNPTRVFAIQRFQMDMLEVAIKAYDVIPLKDRISISTTFSIHKDMFEMFKSRIREIQQEFMEKSWSSYKPDQVYQLTVNLFPVSRSKNNEK